MPSETTPNLSLPLIIRNQSGKEVTHNEALVIIDVLLNNGIIDKDLATPPVSPNEGDTYIVANSATGDWENYEGYIAFYNNGWRFISPNEGFTVWINDEDLLYTYTGSSWVASGGSTVTDLDDLTDVELTSPTQYDLLSYNGSNFVNTQEIQFNNLTLTGLSALKIVETNISKKLISADKSTAYNKDFGIISGTVCEGNDSRLSDARTPTAHNLAGSEHNSDTLSNLNAKISDATLIDTNDSRLSDSRKCDNTFDNISTTKTNLSLNNVDNTSDLNKPISTATQTALNLKADDNAVVHLTGNESIGGEKNFTTGIKIASSSLLSSVSTGTSDNDKIPTQGYVDDEISAYNPFDQDLNTTDTPNFAGLTTGDITYLGSDLLVRFNSPSDQNEALDQEFASKDATSSETSPWQSFTAGDTGYLSAVSIHNGSGGTVTEITIKIYSGEGVGGSQIAEETGISCANNVFTKVDLSDLPYITSGQKYTIQVISTGDQYYWSINTGGGYSGGTFITSGQDALFKTYVSEGFNFAFDKTNNRIGIGTLTPSYTLDITGNFNLDGDINEVSAIIHGDDTDLGTNWQASTKQTMGILAADAEISLVSDGGGSVGSAIILDEVNSSTQAYVDHWSIWRQTNAVGSSLVGYYGTSAGVSGSKIFEFGSSGRCWIAGLSGHASYAYMRYDTASNELFYNTSALRYKENIDYDSNEILDRAKKLVENVKVCQFDMKDGSIKGKIGMIADDIELIEPKLCYYNGNNEIEGYNDGDTVPYLIKYIQYQKGIIEDLTNRVKVLENNKRKKSLKKILPKFNN